MYLSIVILFLFMLCCGILCACVYVGRGYHIPYLNYAALVHFMDGLYGSCVRIVYHRLFLNVFDIPQQSLELIIYFRFMCCTGNVHPVNHFF